MSTYDLRQEFMSSPNLDEFLSENEGNFYSETLPETDFFAFAMGLNVPLRKLRIF